MIFDRGGDKLAQEPAEGPDLVGVGGFSWSLELEWESGIFIIPFSNSNLQLELLLPLSNSNSSLELKRQNLLFAVAHCDSG